MTLKIDKRKKYVMILDVETNRDQEICDLGFLIGDLEGNIVAKRAFMVKEHFQVPFYFERLRPLYRERLKDPNYPMWLASAKKVGMEIEKAIRHFRVAEVYAYNAGFDKRKVEQLANKFDFPNPLRNVEVDCLWFWSAQTIFQQKSFVNFANEHNFLTEKGNIKTSAEVCYAYINGIPEFEEEHTGLEDCVIEYEIFLHCKKQRKFRAKGICHNPWLLVQSKEQIEKLPPQFRTMKFNLEFEIERAEMLVDRMEKDLKIELEEKDF